MFKKFISLVFTLSTLFLVIACGPTKPQQQEVKYTHFKMGEPKALLYGTTATPYFSENVFKSSANNYQLIKVMTVDAMINRPKKLDKKTKGPEAINGGQIVYDNDAVVNNDFRLTKEGSTYILSNKNNSRSFHFSQSETGGWYLSDYKESQRPQLSDKYTLTPEHVSVSYDNSYISFLNTYEDKYIKGNRGLVAFYLHIGDLKPRTREELTKKQTDLLYVYPYAPRWNPKKILTIELCNSAELIIQNDIKHAVSSWSEVLKNRLDIRFDITKEPTPFSDLNTRCINVIDGILQNSNDNIQSLGMAHLTVDHNTNTFVDADIFIFNNEFKKIGKSIDNEINTYLRQFTFLHELGHLLGLDHKFDGTPSIMSYSMKLAPQLYPYDIRAIQNLYPEK